MISLFVKQNRDSLQFG